jgi:hypothetical protein
MKIFKKIVTVLGSALMIGSSVGMAAAASYTAPFVQSGAADVAVIYGSNAALSDVVGAASIQSDLATALAAQTATGGGTTTTASITGEAVSLDTSSTRIWLNTSLNTAKEILTKTDLPTVLGDYTFSGNADAKLTSSINFISGAAAGAANSGKVIFEKQPKSSDDPNIGISLGAEQYSLYNATITFGKEVAFNHSDSEGENIKLFGREFVVSTSTDGDTLVLFSSAEEVTLVAGGDSPNPSISTEIGGTSYDVELVSGSDDTATIKVNGESKEVSEGSSKKISGLEVAVKSVDESTALNIITASILIGSEKITFEDGAQVTKGADEDPVDGTRVFLGGSDASYKVSTMTELTVEVYKPTSSTDAIKAGETFVDPTFGSFKLDFIGLSSGLDDAGRDTISIENSGDKAMSLTFTDDGENTGTIDFAYNKTGLFNMTDDNSYTIHVIEGANISENEYMVLGNEEYGHLVQVTQIYNNTGTEYSNDKVTFSDVMSGESYSTTFTAEGDGTVTIEGKQYEVFFRGDGDDGWLMIKYPSSESNANSMVVYPTIKTKNGAKIALIEPQRFCLSNFTWAGEADKLTTIKLPDGDGYTDVTVTWDEAAYLTTAENYTNITVSGTGVTAGGDELNLSILSDVYNFTIGDITYYLKSIAAYGDTLASTCTTEIGLLNVAMQGQATTNLTMHGTDDAHRPGVLIWEEKDDNNEYKVVYVDLETNPAGSSSDGVGVNDVLFTSDTRWSKTLASDSDIEKEVDWWGTVVTTDSSDSDQKTVSISYPDNQVYAQIYIGEDEAVISGSTTTSSGTATELGKVTYEDSEITSVQGKNLLVVGGSCINSVAANLLGQGACGADFTALTDVSSGEFLIETFDSPYTSGKVAMLVAGYNAADTTKAVTYLTNNAVDTTSGTKLKGTSATEATVVTA